MNKVIMTSVLALMMSSVFAGSAGSSRDGNRNGSNNRPQAERRDQGQNHDQDRNSHQDKNDHGGWDRNDRGGWDKGNGRNQHGWSQWHNDVHVYYTPSRPTYYGSVCHQEPVQCGPVAMCEPEFCQLKQTINNAGFEDTKLYILKQALCSNYFTSQQVLDLMNLFCFESYKLNVAKMAYAKTVDPNHYYVVYNGFTFNSSINELGDYLAMN